MWSHRIGNSDLRDSVESDNCILVLSITPSFKKLHSGWCFQYSNPVFHSYCYQMIENRCMALDWISEVDVTRTYWEAAKKNSYHLKKDNEWSHYSSNCEGHVNSVHQSLQLKWACFKSSKLLKPDSVSHTPIVIYFTVIFDHCLSRKLDRFWLWKIVLTTMKMVSTFSKKSNVKILIVKYTNCR